MTATLTQPALKEWSAAVRALLDGRQTVLLRKGGIHEKRFAITASRFLLFPTVAHSHRERVRPEHRDLLDAAAADSTDEALVVRAGAKVVAAVEVNRPEAIDEIASLHIWASSTCYSQGTTGSTSGRSTGSPCSSCRPARWSSPFDWPAHPSTRAARAGFSCRSTRPGRIRCATMRRFRRSPTACAARLADYGNCILKCVQSFSKMQCCFSLGESTLSQYANGA